MIVPTTQRFDSVPVAGVFITTGPTEYWMKLDPTSGVELFAANIKNDFPPDFQVQYVPSAQLVLG